MSETAKRVESQAALHWRWWRHEPGENPADRDRVRLDVEAMNQAGAAMARGMRSGQMQFGFSDARDRDYRGIWWVMPSGKYKLSEAPNA